MATDPDGKQHVDTARCPLCNAANGCAMATGGAGNSPGAVLAPCWCEAVRVDGSALARVPPAARGRVCICARCAAQATHASIY